MSIDSIPGTNGANADKWQGEWASGAKPQADARMGQDARPGWLANPVLSAQDRALIDSLPTKSGTLSPPPQQAPGATPGQEASQQAEPPMTLDRLANGVINLASHAPGFGSLMKATGYTPTPADEAAGKALWNKISPKLHLGLDIFGAVPFPPVSTPANLANAAVHAGEGHWKDAGLNLLGAIPIPGLGTASKFIRGGEKLATVLKDAERGAEVAQGVMKETAAAHQPFFRMPQRVNDHIGYLMSPVGNDRTAINKLYRGDSRPPGQMFGGFTPQGTNTDLGAHLSFRGDSAFISTSTSKNAAATYAFGRTNSEASNSGIGYLYKFDAKRIDDSQKVNILEKYKNDPAAQRNQEIAIQGDIPPTAIKGAYTVTGDRHHPKIGKFTKNPDYA